MRSSGELLDPRHWIAHILEERNRSIQDCDSQPFSEDGFCEVLDQESLLHLHIVSLLDRSLTDGGIGDSFQIIRETDV